MFATTCLLRGYLLGCLLMSLPVEPRVKAMAQTMEPKMSKFKAAVYGHALIAPNTTGPPASRDQALANMKKNLDVFETVAAQAKEQNVDILVFPEDGIYGYQFSDRDSIYHYLEVIPDPRATSWSPCDDPDLYSNTEVQRSLSCLAKSNSLYLVANMGDRQPCARSLDPRCPPDGRYQYNTDVAFGPDGTLLAKYHKSHLFYEDQFDEADPEVAYFDTPFGRFGMQVCFDVLFHDPIIPMVLQYNISNIVFPTAWMDALPLLSAIGFHSSFARGVGVNFLAANLHIPELRFHGSGVYTPEGMKGFFYGASSAVPPRLVVAEIDVLPAPTPNINIPNGAAVAVFHPDTTKVDKQNTIVESNEMRSSNESVSSVNGQDCEFESVLFGDKFTFQSLDEPSGKVVVRQKDVHCQLDYQMDRASFGSDFFAFGAFDGLHTLEGQYYFQICALVKCADARNKSSCGAVTDTSSTGFLQLQIQAEMTTYYIYPQLIVSGEDAELKLTPSSFWSFKDSTLWTSAGFNQTVLTAALFGRDYTRDGIDYTRDDGNTQDGSGGGNGAATIFWDYEALVPFILGALSNFFFCVFGQ